MEKQYKQFKELNDGSKIFYKTFECQDLKFNDDELVFEGYANTKNQPDAYGDIPTNYKGEAVYDLSRFSKNPVMFVDHHNSLSMVMGKFTLIQEDERGLFVRLKLMPQEEAHTPEVKHAISAFKTGFGRALSIGGRWHFEDKENPTHLTKAYIHEISGVGVGADEDALVRPKSLETEESQAQELRKGLEALVATYRDTQNPEILTQISQKSKELKGVL